MTLLSLFKGYGKYLKKLVITAIRQYFVSGEQKPENTPDAPGEKSADQYSLVVRDHDIRDISLRYIVRDHDIVIVQQQFNKT